ncbi:hypothetical protein Tco_0850183 [Tanacetum coccineum]
MAQQPLHDVSRDQLCPPNKQYDFMDANKKIDLTNPILGDILNHHLLQFSLAASALVPWIYIQEFWHSLKLDDSKDKFKFFLDTKEFKFSVDDFRRMFQFPQATKNNNVAFVDAPTFSDILPFFKNELGFFLPIHFPTYFMTKGLPQPWTANPEILKRLHEHYHRASNDDIVKLIFNSGKNKEGEEMWILDWMLTEEMKLTRHYQMSTNLFATQGESSAPRKPTVIKFRVRNQLDPKMPIPTATKIDIDKHLVEEEIETMVEGTENVDEHEFMDEIFISQEDLSTRLELGSHKGSPEVKKSADVLIINDDDEEEESIGDALIRRKREKWKGI